MKTVIITGAGGYIGSRLTPFLIEKGYKIRAVDRFFFGNNLKKNQNLEIIKNDIRLIEDDIFKNANYLIDLAAISNDVSGERFEKETFDINYKARVNNAKLAKKNGLQRYIFPSSCSNYGLIRDDQIADENFKTNPLTNYSKANSIAESEILPLSDKNFCVTVLRQGTVYGYSPKMRFDLVVNRMTYEAWKYRKLPLMKDGTQRRPTLHIEDAISAMKFMLTMDTNIINNQIYNVGGDNNNFTIKDLANEFQKYFDNSLKINWYGSKDTRSYFVSFEKIKKIGFNTKFTPYDGIKEIADNLEKGNIDLTPETITLDWYEKLEKLNKKNSDLAINNKMLKFN